MKTYQFIILVSELAVISAHFFSSSLSHEFAIFGYRLMYFNNEINRLFMAKTFLGFF